MTDTRSTDATNTTDPTAPKSAKGKGGKLKKPAAAARKAIEDGAEAVRAQANAALHAGSAALDSAPLTALAGAIALGAVTAALLPNTTRELDTLGPLGNRVRGALDDAFAAAKAAGVEQLTAKGLTAAATTSGVGALLGAIVKAAVAANSAANTTLRDPVPAAADTAPTPDNQMSPPQAS